MDTVIEPQQQSEPELRLLTDWSPAGARLRWREAAIGSITAHIAVIILLASLPNGVFQPSKRIVDARKITPLVAPPFELTQPNPNKGKISNRTSMFRGLTAPHPVPAPLR